MDFLNFGLHHSYYVKNFPFSGFEECQQRLEILEDFICVPLHQEAHDRLVDSTYRWFEELGDFEEYEIVEE